MGLLDKCISIQQWGQKADVHIFCILESKGANRHSLCSSIKIMMMAQVSSKQITYPFVTFQVPIISCPKLVCYALNGRTSVCLLQGTGILLQGIPMVHTSLLHPDSGLPCLQIHALSQSIAFSIVVLQDHAPEALGTSEYQPFRKQTLATSVTLNEVDQLC